MDSTKTFIDMTLKALFTVTDKLDISHPTTGSIYFSMNNGYARSSIHFSYFTTCGSADTD